MIYRQSGNNRAYFEYVPYSSKNPDCVHVILSQRAYNTILAETFSYDGLETGGVLIGHIFRRIWYVTDVIPPGISTQHTMVHFRLDLDFVNFLAGKIGDVYKYKPTILGIWHRHPGSMDVFSQEDFETIYANERSSRYGILTMLVNIDPDVRMTFYHARNGRLMKLHYDQGDEYFPSGLMDMATSQELLKRRKTNEGGRGLKIAANHTFDPEKLPRTLEIPTPRPAPGTEPVRPSSVPEPAPADVAAYPVDANANPAVAHNPAEVPFVFGKKLKAHVDTDNNDDAATNENGDGRQDDGEHAAQPQYTGDTARQPVMSEEDRRRKVALDRLNRKECPGVWDLVDAFVHKRYSMLKQSDSSQPVMVIGYRKNHKSRLIEDLIDDLVDVLDAWQLADGTKRETIRGKQLEHLLKTQYCAYELGRKIPRGVAIIHTYELRQNDIAEKAMWDFVNNRYGIFPILVCYDEDYNYLSEKVCSYGNDVLKIFI